jgi:hypothetical protein
VEQILAGLMTKMNAIQGRIETKIGAKQGKADAWLEEMKTRRKETTACQEATKAYLEREPTPVKTASVAAHTEESNKEDVTDTVGALKDQYGDRHLAVGHRRQPKKRTQGDGGSWQKLAAA